MEIYFNPEDEAFREALRSQIHMTNIRDKRIK